MKRKLWCILLTTIQRYKGGIMRKSWQKKIQRWRTKQPILLQGFNKVRGVKIIVKKFQLQNVHTLHGMRVDRQPSLTFIIFLHTITYRMFVLFRIKVLGASRLQENVSLRKHDEGKSSLHCFQLLLMVVDDYDVWYRTTLLDDDDDSVIINLNPCCS